MKRVLAVASGGGHWKQLMLLRNAFENCDQLYVTTIEGLAEENQIEDYRLVKDSNKKSYFSAFVTTFQLFKIVVSYRPDCIISTGAAPGALCLLLGKMFRCETIWVDSIANADELSLGGKMCRHYADVVLTQWEHLADGGNVRYEGSVL